MPHQPLLVCTMEELSFGPSQPFFPSSGRPSPTSPSNSLPMFGLRFCHKFALPKVPIQKGFGELENAIETTVRKPELVETSKMFSPNPFHLAWRNELNEAQWLAEVAQQATGGTGLRANPTPLAREASKASFSLVHELPVLNDCWAR